VHEVGNKIECNNMHGERIKIIKVSLTCFEHLSVHLQEGLYIQFYGITYMHPYKQTGRCEDVLGTMHASIIVMFANAQQAKQLYQYQTHLDIVSLFYFFTNFIGILCCICIVILQRRVCRSPRFVPALDK